jgi:hypothetical protein
MSDLKLLTGPPLRRVKCSFCDGKGHVSLSHIRPDRTCPTCRGSGVDVEPRPFGPLEYRAFQLGLEPRVALPQPNTGEAG